MSKVITPVLLSLFLGPGVGQLYNREYKKATYLIVLSLGVLAAGFVWIKRALTPYLPPDLTTVDPSALQGLLQNAVAQMKNGRLGVLYAYEFILTALWVYSIVDAYRGAMRRRPKEE